MNVHQRSNAKCIREKWGLALSTRSACPRFFRTPLICSGSSSRRSGVAILWVLFVLALVSALAGLTMKDHYTNRQFLDQRQKRLQADWLSRAGIELATTRLLASEQPFKLAVTDFVANSKVEIEVTAAPNAKNTFLLTSASHFPTNEARPVFRTQTRRMKRIADKGQVRLEAETGEAKK